jgi:hypothetical protein
MAETITQVTQPPAFIEAESKLYLDQLRNAIGGLKGADLSQIMGPQFIAGQDPLQLQAQQAALAGIGGYQPYLQSAAASAGPTAYQQFMSPYQQDVIDTTLADYDIQAQKGLPALAAQAINAGAFGGGREGVQRAEYLSASDRNRAALQAQLLQQGFGQAQGLAQQNITNQLQLGQAQQGFLGQDVGALSTLGGINQAQNQAVLSAQQQLGQAQLQQPLSTAQQYGSGIMGLISGYPGGTQQTIQPTPGALQTALGAGSTLAGIYSAFNPRPLYENAIGPTR